VGLAGVTIVMWPRLSFDMGDLAFAGAMATLASATLAALAQVFVKLMVDTEKTTAIVFWFSATASVLALLSIPFGWVMPNSLEWAILITMGLMGGVGQIMLTTSYKYAEASTLAPFTYSSMIWALLLGYFFFGEVPTLGMLAGATLVIAAGVAIVLRERALGMQRTAERKMTAQIKQ
jgi:drug/metabolite transporter (DMT)-like permease